MQTYFFNSQWLISETGNITILFPRQCAEHPEAQAAIAWLQQHEPRITQIHYVDLEQSMRGGGGPACLRLRVPLTTQHIHQLPQGTPD